MVLRFIEGVISKRSRSHIQDLLAAAEILGGDRGDIDQ